MIDLHSHFIPDWDDGPGAIEDSLRMCEKAREDGITDIVLTPHMYRATRHGDNLDLLTERYTAFVERAQATGLVFHRGAEVFVLHDIIDRVREHPELRMAGSAYVLVEFAVNSLPPTIRDIFYQMQLAGFTPVIAHPERNTIFQNRPEQLYELIAAGALAQVTAQSITGEFGGQAKAAVTLFLKHRWAQIIATDAHSLRRREPVLSKAVNAAAGIVGKAVASAMTSDVPRAIIEDKALPELGDPIPPKPPRSFRIPFLRWGHKAEAGEAGEEE